MMDHSKSATRELYVFAAALAATLLIAVPAQAQRTSLDTIDQKLNAVQQQLQQHDDDIKALLDAVMPDESKLVFVTSTLHDGGLGGLAGADDICNQHAVAAGLPGVYLAWLSTEFNSPSNRFNRATVPYVRTDGITVADNWIDLTDGTLRNPISTDEFGIVILSDFGVEGGVWTNTRIDGTALITNAGNTCRNFADGSEFPIDGRIPTARIGFIFDFLGGVAEGWTDRIDSRCGSTKRLYCFEQ